jgi:hypothetical protein
VTLCGLVEILGILRVTEIGEEMAILDKATRGTLLGVGMGAGAVLAIRYVGPVLVAIARPLAKALISRGMDGFETASLTLAGAAESFQDLVAEVRAERGRLPEADPTAPVAGGKRAGEPNPGVN